jgi:hypothetical protein
MSEEYTIGPFLLQKFPVVAELLRMHPHYQCAACHEPFRIGDVHAMVPVGPGNNPEARARARAGLKADVSSAVPVHWACATGEE